MGKPPDFFSQRKILLALYLFLVSFLLRVVLNLVFFLRSGWFSSHLIEVWFYYGVAQNIFKLSRLRRTFLFRLRYEPDKLKYFRPIYAKVDPEKKIGVWIYKLK